MTEKEIVVDREKALRILATNQEDTLYPVPERGRRVTPAQVDEAKRVAGVGMGDLMTKSVPDPLAAAFFRRKHLPMC